MEIKYLRILQVPQIYLNSDTFLEKKIEVLENNSFYCTNYGCGKSDPLSVNKHKSIEDAANGNSDLYQLRFYSIPSRIVCRDF